MNTSRFDEISRMLSRRGSRRGLVAGSLGLAAAAAGDRAVAQEATPTLEPNDPHPAADTATAEPEFLYVQPFNHGAWLPKPGEDGVYTLTLSGADANTVYFSDRPDRIVGLAPTQQFLDGLGFTPDNPPNAAIVAERVVRHDTQEVLIVELLNPVYDLEASTLTYDATVLADYGEHGLAHLAALQQDYELPELFGSGSLFIDDCPDKTYHCYVLSTGETVGNAQGNCCFDVDKFKCTPCRSAERVCSQKYPDQCLDSNGNYLCVSS